MTEAKTYAAHLARIPGDIPGLVRTLQGLAVHIFWAERCGLALSDERKQEVGLRTLPRKLARLLELDDAPLDVARPLERRLVSNCRDFSVLAAGVLRARGVPARARCGFGTYFRPNHYEDHWVVEAWDAPTARWVRFDAQIDEMMRGALKLTFDTHDMGTALGTPFVTAGEAWRLCRKGQADPDAFGIFQWKGWDFIKGNLYRDLLALNKVEILPWDFWPGMGAECAALPPEGWARLDRLAELTQGPAEDFDAVRGVYEQDLSLRVPAEWTN
jgi:hypothetical protein